MKLLYIAQYFGFPEKAGGTRAYDLATSFAQRGIQVRVITSDTSAKKKERWSEFERDGIKFYQLSCPYNNKMGFIKRIKSFIYFLFFSSIKALTIDCDVVLATSTPLTIGVPALLMKWIRRKPFIFEVRDEGMIGAVVDLWSLSRTKKIWGSYYSSYSEMAAILGNINLEII